MTTLIPLTYLARSLAVPQMDVSLADVSFCTNVGIVAFWLAVGLARFLMTPERP